MRMPILSYFVFVGAALLGVLVFMGNTMAPAGLPFVSSQQVGLPPPYEAPPIYSAEMPQVAPVVVELPMPPTKPAQATLKKNAKIAKKPVSRDRYAEYPRTWNSPYGRF